MNILSVVEATNVNAVAKLVLDFYKTAGELSQAHNDFPRVEGSIATFDRTQPGVSIPNDFINAVRAAHIELDVIPESGRFDFSVIPALKRVAEKRRPHIIVTNSVKSHVVMWRSRLWQTFPWVAFHHGYTATDVKMRIYNRFDSFSLAKAGLVVTVCDAFARELVTVARVSRDKIRVQHNSVRPAPQPPVEEVCSLRERLGISNDERVVLSIGRLSKEKAHVDLISAFQQLCETNSDLNCKLVIVGDGPEREALAEAAQSPAIAGRVVFTGQVSDVQPFYAIADVFVLSSHSEGSPNVLLEAMAARVPVVATSVGGVPEIVEHERNALLTPAKDAAALAGALATMLNDSDLAARLAQAAAVAVATNHTPEQYADALIKIYDEAIRSHRP